MNTEFDLPLSPQQGMAFESLRSYLEESKHQTIQKRVYSRSGEFHFYDASSLEDCQDDSKKISLFRAGPDADDFYINLIRNQNRFRLQVLKSFIAPEEFIPKAQELLLNVGTTAAERLDSIGEPHPVTTPFGYSLWSMKGAEGSEANFERSVVEGVFSQEFADYCNQRTFCLKFRPRS